MATTSKPFTSFSDVLKKHHVEPLTYETNKRALAENNVVFCVTNVKRVPVNNPDINANEQWMFTIQYANDNGQVRTKLMPVGFSEMRDEVVNALISELDNMAENDRIVHGLMLEAVTLAKYDNPYYNIVPANAPCLHQSEE